ncbi:MAG: hypothetical protein ACOC9S_02715 [Planctomycetota bacterium]
MKLVPRYGTVFGHVDVGEKADVHRAVDAVGRDAQTRGVNFVGGLIPARRPGHCRTDPAVRRLQQHIHPVAIDGFGQCQTDRCFGSAVGAGQASRQ